MVTMIRIVLAAFCGAIALQPSPIPSDGAIQQLLAERVHALTGSAPGANIGIVVALVRPGAHRVISSGPFGGKTVFEIGSVGKVFTALLFADMVQRGEVALTDPVSTYLPQMRLPSRGGRSITLVDLATHTSGLPFMPPQTVATPADVRAFLARYEIHSDVGSRWEYSNLGYWLLGEALASRAKMDFDRLLHARVLSPLGLSDTGFSPTGRLKDNLAVGHDASLRESPPVSTLPAYSYMHAAGAGLLSTADDLAALLAAAMGGGPSPLGAAFAASVATRRSGGEQGGEQALGWTVIRNGDDEVIFRDGGTLGHASCLAWDPRMRTGVVVLSNQMASVADIARHLLRPEFPLEHPTVVRQTAIAIETHLLDAYAGRYEATGEGLFVIAREGDHLVFTAPEDWGLPPLRVRASSATEFFATELPLRVTFQTAPDGAATGILVYPPRGQKPVPANRVRE